MQRNIFTVFGLILLVCVTSIAYGQVRTIKITVPKENNALISNVRTILIKQITNRADVKVVHDQSAQFTIELVKDRTGAPESFRIEDNGANYIRITGSDEAGILYGAGKFLRSSRFGPEGLAPGLWRGSMTPQGKVRGMYFASHFRNFYEEASVDEMQNYVEELALWGVNYLLVTFPTFQFTSFHDPGAQKVLAHLRQILGIAKTCGMKVGLTDNPNNGFKYTSADLLNTPIPDPLGRRGNFGVNLDPAHPRAHQLLKENWAEIMGEFKDIGLDMIVFWPYDEGGCGCNVCWPWGAKGFPKISKELAGITRSRFPEAKIVLSTWMYDTPQAGEWDGLTTLLSKGNNWLDYVMADAHEDFPRYPIEKGVPGRLPLLNFPEISMWGQDPWGGFGANPLTGRLQNLWNQTNNKLTGGFPYSEGIYEDMNKVICTQLYWSNGKVPTTEIVKEYVAYEYSPDAVNELTKAIEILESNHNRKQIKENAIEAFNLISQAEKKLTPKVLKSWRWRILYLRALIDQEMFKRNGKLEGETLKAAFNELTEIYHAQNVHSMPVKPPVIK